MASLEFDIKVKTQELESAKKKVKELTETLKEQKEALEELKVARQLDRENLQKLADAGKKGSDEYQELAKDIQETSQNINRLGIEINGTQREINETKNAISNTEKELKKFSKGANGVSVSTRSMSSSFVEGVKATNSLGGGFKALGLILKANPFGVIITAVYTVIGVFKSLYNNLQPVKDLFDGISKTINNAGTAVANFFGLETTSQHEKKIEQIEDAKKKLQETKDSVKDLEDEIEKLKEKDLTPKDKLERLTSQLNDATKEVGAYQKQWDKKPNEWKRTNSEGTLATNLKGAKTQKELIELQIKELNDIIKKEDDKLKEEQRKKWESILKERKSYIEQLLKDADQWQYASRQREIDNMNDETAKTLAQLELNKQKELDAIEKYKKDKLKAYNEAYGTRYKSVEDLPENARTPILATTSEREKNANNTYDLGVANVKNQLVGEFSSLTSQLEKIETTYNKKVKDVENSTLLNDSEKAERINTLTKQKENEFKTLAKKASEILKKNPKLAQALNWQSAKTFSELNSSKEYLSKFKEFLKTESGSEQEGKLGQLLFGENWQENAKVLKKDQETINENLEETEDALNGISNVKTGLQKIRDTFKNLAKGDSIDFKENLQNALGYINQITDEIQSASNYMHELAEISGNTKLEKTANTMDKVTNNLKSSIEGASVGASIGGGWGALIGGIAGSVTSIVSTMIKNNAKFQYSVEESKKTYKQFVDLVNESKYDLEDSIFGDLGTKQLVENLKEVNNEVEKLYQKKYISKTIGGGYFDYTDFQKIINAFGENGNGMFNFFNEDGTYNLTTLKSLLESGEYKRLIDSTKGLGSNATEEFENAVNLLIKQDELSNQLNDSLSSTFSSLGSDLADDLVSAFQTGEDAGKKMANSINDVFNNYYQKKLSSDINNWLNQYQQDIIDAENSGNLERAENLKERMKNEFESYYGTLQDEYSKYITTSDSSSSTSSTKGIAQASQDSVDELNGRFTAIQSHTFQIAETTKEIREKNETILNEIMGIHGDTSIMRNDLNKIRSYLVN